jgi:tetratricopeptide (TPR) repeat protein
MHWFVVRLFLAAQLGLGIGSFAAVQENKTVPDVQSATRQQDQADKNLANLKKQLSDLETTKGKQHPDLLPVLKAIAKAYRVQGAYVTALPFTERGLQIAKTVYGENDLRVANELDALGTLDLVVGDTKGAIENYQLARPNVEKYLGAEHPLYAMLLVKVGAAYLADGRFEEAESASTNAKQILVKDFGPAAAEMTAAQEVLGELYLRKGEYSKAEKELVVALSIRSEGLSYRPSDMTEADVRLDMAPLQNLLGALYTAVGRYDEAGPVLNDALKAYEAKLGKNHPSLEEVLVNLAALAAAKGDPAAADVYRKRAESIHKENLGVAHLATVPLPQPFKAAPAGGPNWILYLAPLILLAALGVLMIRQTRRRSVGVGEGPSSSAPPQESKPRFGP